MRNPMTIVSLALICLVAPGSLLAREGPLTVAEATSFAATSRHADVMGFIREL